MENDVYEPAEDSFLLAKYARYLKGKILEMGCGSGIVSIECAASNKNNKVIGVDINPEAVRVAKENAKKRKIKNVKFYTSNLFSKVKGKFDYILFNPPYLPTTKNERLDGAINFAFDGGYDGRKLIKRFIEKVGRYLKKKGAVYLITSSLCEIEKVKKLFAKNGFKAEEVEEESFFFEKIVLIKAVKR